MTCIQIIISIVHFHHEKLISDVREILFLIPLNLNTSHNIGYQLNCVQFETFYSMIFRNQVINQFFPCNASAGSKCKRRKKIYATKVKASKEMCSLGNKTEHTLYNWRNYIIISHDFFIIPQIRIQFFQLIKKRLGFIGEGIHCGSDKSNRSV